MGLKLPWPLRLLFASRRDALGRCLAVIIRAVETGLIQRRVDPGVPGADRCRDPHSALRQRLEPQRASAHDHLDGIYTLEGDQPHFHRVKAPDRQHLERLLNRIIARVMRRFVKDGLLIPDPEQPWLDLQEPDTVDTPHQRYRFRNAL